MPGYILWLSEIDKNDVPLVRGKAADPGEMTRNGIPVPNGFTMTVKAYFDFLKEAGLSSKIKSLLDKVDPNNSSFLNETSNLIKISIEKSPLSEVLVKQISTSYKKLMLGKPHFVAVRSSATAEDLPDASFAGQQATLLNIKDEKQLLEAIIKCWASLFEPRAIFYRNEKKFDHTKVGIAVVVQQMVPSEVSGVMFTIDPVENDKNKIIIEAIFGLGELIVQGTVTPDHYEVDKKTLKITNKKIEFQPKMMVRSGLDNKILTLAKKQGSNPK